jgi:hypothetical protein
VIESICFRLVNLVTVFTMVLFRSLVVVALSALTLALVVALQQEPCFVNEATFLPIVEDCEAVVNATLRSNETFQPSLTFNPLSAYKNASIDNHEQQQESPTRILPVSRSQEPAKNPSLIDFIKLLLVLWVMYPYLAYQMMHPLAFTFVAIIVLYIATDAKDWKFLNDAFREYQRRKELAARRRDKIASDSRDIH